MQQKKLVEILVELIRRAETIIPKCVEKSLRNAYRRESSEIAKLQLETILRNIEMAKEKKLPICQDTGTLLFFVDMGTDFPYRSILEDAIYSSVWIATERIPLRPNCVDPLTGKNTGNIGRKSDG